MRLHLPTDYSLHHKRLAGSQYHTKQKICFGTGFQSAVYVRFRNRGFCHWLLKVYAFRQTLSTSLDTSAAVKVFTLDTSAAVKGLYIRHLCFIKGPIIRFSKCGKG